MSKYLGHLKKANEGNSAAPFHSGVKEKGAHKPKRGAAHSLAKRVKAHVAKLGSLVVPHEAEQSTAQTQLVRGKTKESAQRKVPCFLEVGGRFLEKAPGDNTASARVVLIQEGLGNLHDGYYYTKEALKLAAEGKVFEGKKMYADHPSKMEEAILPERSTRDIVGHYEDVAYEELEDGTGVLTANLLLLRGDPYVWAHTLVERAVDYAKKYNNQQFIGLSINASGSADPMDAEDFLAQMEIPDSAKKKVEDAINEGLNQIKVVKSFDDAVSVDLVTEAGAKGKILELLEAEKLMKNKVKESEAEKKEKKEKKESETESEAEQAEAGDDADGDGGSSDDHDDEDADKALVMQMLKKQGLVSDDTDEAEAKEAYEVGHQYMKQYKAEGHEGEEAAMHAAKAMKCAAAVHAAMNKAKDDGDKANDNDADDKQESEGESHKEAKAMVELKAEVARLRESVRKNDLEKYLDKKMKESGLPSHVTKLFKEAVEGMKSEKEIDKAFTTFSKVYKLDRNDGFVESVEKQVRTQSKSAVDLSDCVADEI